MGYDALWIIPHALRIHSSGLLRKLDPWKYVLISFRLCTDLAKFARKIFFNNNKEKKLKGYI